MVFNNFNKKKKKCTGNTFLEINCIFFKETILNSDWNYEQIGFSIVFFLIVLLTRM